MRVRCPNCRASMPTNANDGLSTDLTCDNCGSQISFADSPTATDVTRSGTLGHFRLLRQVGRGAYGTVWMAFDNELQRTVAVKIPRKGQLTAEETEQFVREARAAAQLNHPSIVAVHEIGRIDDQIYIVSDFVHGATLAESLAIERPDPRAAAELTKTLAEALHHAHSAGVVHRDFKPGNIMVDESGAPHVMDFGLAKRETADVTMTVEGKILGTPSYMSPEHARGEGHRADRRSDIYSLGVVLYQLLTGELPFRGSPQMLILQILRDEPPPPRKLNAHIPKDLEVICLRCVQKNPDKRYQTAQEVAEDLQRHLDGKPILARPVGRIERLARWAARNPRVASLTAAVMLLLTVVAVGSVIAAMAMREKEQDALLAKNEAVAAQAKTLNALEDAQTARAQAVQSQRETERAKADLEVSLGETQAAQAEAEQNLDRALRAVETMLSEVAHDRLVGAPYMEPVRKRLLEEALTFYQEFLEGNEDDARMQRAVARAQMRVGTINLWLGHFAESDAALQAAERISRELVAELGSQASLHRLLARVLYWKGMLNMLRSRDPAAEQAFLAALEIQNAGIELAGEGEFYAFERCDTLQMLGKLLLETRLAESEQYLLQAIAISDRLIAAAEDDDNYIWQRANILHNLGLAASHRSDWATTESRYLQSLTFWRRLYERQPLPDVTGELARLQLDLGVYYFYAGQQQRSEDYYDEALSLLKRLALDFPSVPNFQSDLAIAYGNLAFNYESLGRDQEALEAYGQAIEVISPLYATYEDVADYASRLANLHNNLGILHLENQEFALALEPFEKALAVRRTLVERYSDNPDYKSQLGATLHNIVEIRVRSGENNLETTEHELTTAIEYQQQALDANKEHQTYQMYLRNHLWRRARVRVSLERYAQAAADFEAALPFADQLGAALPSNAAHHSVRVGVRYFYAWMLANCRDASLREPNRALALVNEAVELRDDDVNLMILKALCEYRLGEWQAAQTTVNSAAELRGEEHPYDWLISAMAKWHAGDHDAARELLDKVVTHRKENSMDEQDLDDLFREASELIKPDLLQRMPN